MKMKKVLSVLIIIAMTVLFLSGIVYAELKKATPAEAKAQVKKMVAYVKQVGAEKAFAEFNDPKSPWNNFTNLWCSGGDWDGITRIQGKYPQIVGQNHMDLKDTNGKPFVKNALEKCKQTGRAIEEYTWMDTKTNKIGIRTMYVEAVDCGSKYGKVDVGITYDGKL
jgi:cytochrome c